MSTPSRSSKHGKVLLFSVLGLVIFIAVAIAVILGQGLKGTASAGSEVAATGPMSVVVPTGGQVPPAPSVPATDMSVAPTPSVSSAPSVPPAPGVPVPTESAAPESAAGQTQLAATGVSAFIKQSTATLETTVPPNTEELAAVAVGSAYEGILASAAEFEVNGWRQEGQPVVVFTNVISYDQVQSPDTMSLGVCVDSSKVNVVTESGTVVRAGVTSDRSMNILTMTRNSAGAWVVSQLAFPENPNC